jgi:hypothetical protein
VLGPAWGKPLRGYRPTRPSSFFCRDAAKGWPLQQLHRAGELSVIVAVAKGFVAVADASRASAH